VVKFQTKILSELDGGDSPALKEADVPTAELRKKAMLVLMMSGR
jgi:hypothetical protein